MSSSTEPSSVSSPLPGTSVPTVRAADQPPSDFKVYKPIDRQLVLPDSPPDLEPTAAELRAIQASLSSRTQALVNAPLQLRAQREAEAKSKLSRWPETTIRIRFLDKTQLEKVFPSTVKIRLVYAFVRSCLNEDTKPIKFILYQPPNRDLKVSDLKVRDLTLAELHLAPASVLLVRFEDEKLNHVNLPAPLSSFVLSQAIEFPVAPPEPEQEKAPSPPKKEEPGSVSSSSKSGSSTKEARLAKLLKLGSKYLKPISKPLLSSKFFLRREIGTVV
ncbi:hypothetical protein BJ165DRAFT_1343918 [Panaeolus papilionaceus]|nr:hypothetical protein BJ165DRAFT_1343918 [Panaeolus papilionaceus]